MAQETTGLPLGYTLKESPLINARIPMPDGWFYHEETKGATKAVFLTQESLRFKGIFETGISINVIPNVKRISNVSASKFVRDFLATLQYSMPLSMVKPLGETTRSKEDPFDIYKRHFVIRADTPGIKVMAAIPSAVGGQVVKEFKATHSYYKGVGNTETDTAYLIMFESPSKKWLDDGEIIANTMMDGIILDPAV